MSNPRGAAGYPRNMSIDFRKLDNAALQKYVDHYQLAVRSGLSSEELAVVVRVMMSECLDSLVVSPNGAMAIGTLAQLLITYKAPLAP